MMIDVSTIQTSFVLSQQLTVFISIYEMKHLILWWLGPKLSYKDWGYGKLVHYAICIWFLILGFGYGLMLDVHTTKI